MSDIKYCNSCAHAIAPRYETPLLCGVCFDINPVTGDKVPQPTDWARSIAGQCGQAADMFQQKEPK